MTWGGKRSGAGRPKGSLKKSQHRDETLRTARVVVSCTEAEKNKLKELADAQGMSMSEFILSRCLGG